MKLKEIQLVIKENSNNELSENPLYKCNFCQKNIAINKEKKHILEKMSKNGYYCPFCLSNDFHTKNKNILILSFRSIFGYFYLDHYKIQKSIYLAQIEDYIKKHIEIGLKNPAFKYDPQSLLWFIDFSKVSKKKVPFKEIVLTVKEIIDSFENINDYQPKRLLNKYEQSLKKFHKKRYRPKDKRILLPTIYGCAKTSRISFEETKKFTMLPLT